MRRFVAISREGGGSVDALDRKVLYFVTNLHEQPNGRIVGEQATDCASCLRLRRGVTQIGLWGN